MPTCPRCAALALAFAALAGCDSNNPGRDLDLIQGVYQIEELEFTPISALPPADVDARLNPVGTSLEIFGNDEISLLRVRYLDETGPRRVDLRTTASRGRVTFEGVDQDDDEDLAALLLPRSFTLTYDGDSPRVLTGEFEQSGVDLEPFDPSLYTGENNKSGTLTVRFRRP